MKKHTIFIFPVKQRGMWFKKVSINGNTQPLVKSSEDEILKNIIPEMFPQVGHLFTMDYIPAWAEKKRELSDLGFDIHEQYNFDGKSTIITIVEPTPQPKYTKHTLFFECGKNYNIRVWVDGLRAKELDGAGGVDARMYVFLQCLGQLKGKYTWCSPTNYLEFLPEGWNIEHTRNEKWDIVVVTIPEQP